MLKGFKNNNIMLIKQKHFFYIIRKVFSLNVLFRYKTYPIGNYAAHNCLETISLSD